MSSPEDEDKAEVTLCGVNVGPRSEEPVRFLRTGPRVPPTPGLGVGQTVPPRGSTEGGFQGPRASDYGSQLMAVGEAVLCDPEGLLGITALRGDDIRDEERPDLMALMPTFTEESEAAREPPPVLHQEPRDVRRNPSPVSCWDENSARWQGLNSVVCARPPFPPDLVEVHPAAASSRSLSGPKGGQDGRLTRRGSRGRLNVPKALLQRAPSAEGLTKLASELDSPDDFNEAQRAREGRGATKGGASRERGPTSTRSPDNSRDAHRRAKFPGRENLFYMQGSMPPSPPRRVPVPLERQAAGGRETSPGKNWLNVVVGKGRGRPSYSGVSLETSLPLGTSRSAIQEKKSLGAPSKLALGRSGPSWAQRASAAAPESSTFPPIPGAKTLGRSERHSLLPLPSKQPKHTCTSGKKSVARKPRECEQLARDDDSKRETSPKGQIQTSKPKQSGQSMRFAEGSSGSLSARAQRAPGNPQALVLSQGDISIRRPARSGEFVGLLAVEEGAGERENAASVLVGDLSLAYLGSVLTGTEIRRGQRAAPSSFPWAEWPGCSVAVSLTAAGMWTFRGNRAFPVK
ncbi:uncharacterized protein CXorf49 homolog [Sorex fumeus]|uniref:uncharacterized protein CXorf49 homolog n=1 Tax=Sorex fumeus TaxID=62283 RepID=UPI0024AC834F|nr:uncharacterized protein CXorf49 homolog [Sorex fumeus]XP_055986009.1 uncharacterized protein CXorf49 homolog [Sorex fumeus]